MWRGKTPARKNLEFILAGVGLARKKSKFSSPGQGWREKKSCLASPKTFKFLAKIHKDEPIPCHGEKKVTIFLAGAGLARKNLVFRPEEFSPYPAPSRHTPQKAVSGKKCRALVQAHCSVNRTLTYPGPKFNTLKARDII